MISQKDSKVIYPSQHRKQRTLENYKRESSNKSNVNTFEKRIRRLSNLQFILYIITWLVGIYINGFEPSPPESAGGSAFAFFLNPVVVAHFALAVTTAVVGIMLLSLGWIYGLRRFLLFNAVALASISIAGAGGTSYVFAIGNPNQDSMIMATSFITAAYTSFLSILTMREPSRVEIASRAEVGTSLKLSVAVLGLFYVVFVSGMYVNLFVASSIFSLPPSVARQMLGQMLYSPSGLIHEISGLVLLSLSLALAVLLHRSHRKNLANRAVAVMSLVAYSMFVGILMNVVPAFSPATVATGVPGGLNYLVVEVIVPMLSAAAFVISMLVAMSITYALQNGIYSSRPF